MNVVYAPRALRDLEGIAEYLRVRSQPGAANVLAAIKSTADLLGFFPQMGRVVDDAGHRRLTVPRYPYFLFYRVADDELLILHIRHTSRGPIDPARDL
jgi:plasmid stabilization system protein ParE